MKRPLEYIEEVYKKVRLTIGLPIPIPVPVQVLSVEESVQPCHIFSLPDDILFGELFMPMFEAWSNEECLSILMTCKRFRDVALSSAFWWKKYPDWKKFTIPDIKVLLRIEPSEDVTYVRVNAKELASTRALFPRCLGTLVTHVVLDFKKESLEIMGMDMLRICCFNSSMETTGFLGAERLIPVECKGFEAITNIIERTSKRKSILWFKITSSTIEATIESKMPDGKFSETVKFKCGTPGNDASFRVPQPIYENSITIDKLYIGLIAKWAKDYGYVSSIKFSEKHLELFVLPEPSSPSDLTSHLKIPFKDRIGNTDIVAKYMCGYLSTIMKYIQATSSLKPEITFHFFDANQDSPLLISAQSGSTKVSFVLTSCV